MLKIVCLLCTPLSVVAIKLEVCSLRSLSGLGIKTDEKIVVISLESAGIRERGGSLGGSEDLITVQSSLV